MAELDRSEELLEVNEASSWAVEMDGSLLAVASAHAQKCAADLYMSFAGWVKMRAAVQTRKSAAGYNRYTEREWSIQGKLFLQGVT